MKGCSKCQYGYNYYCNQCKQKADEAVDEDGGMLYCSHCDLLNDYIIERKPCPFCNPTEYKAWELSEKISEMIGSYFDYKRKKILEYYRIVYEGKTHIIAITLFPDLTIKAFCYVENIEKEFEISKITEVEKLEGKFS